MFPFSYTYLHDIMTNFFTEVPEGRVQLPRWQVMLHFKHLSRSGCLSMMQHGNGQGSVNNSKAHGTHVNKHSPDSPKENMLSLLTGLGKGYCCILLPQIRPEGKVLSSQITFGTHMRIATVSVA